MTVSGVGGGAQEGEGGRGSSHHDPSQNAIDRCRGGKGSLDDAAAPLVVEFRMASPFALHASTNRVHRTFLGTKEIHRTTCLVASGSK